MKPICRLGPISPLYGFPVKLMSQCQCFAGPETQTLQSKVNKAKLGTCKCAAPAVDKVGQRNPGHPGSLLRAASRGSERAAALACSICSYCHITMETPAL